MLRDGKNYDYPTISETIDNKVIYKSKIPLKEDDTFVAISDGAIHAGVGMSSILVGSEKISSSF